MLLSAMVLNGSFGSSERVNTLFWNLQLHQSFSCWTSNLSEDVANSKYSKISELFFCNWHSPQYFTKFCEKLIMIKTYYTHTLLRWIPLWCSFWNWILAKVTHILNDVNFEVLPEDFVRKVKDPQIIAIRRSRLNNVF